MTPAWGRAGLLSLIFGLAVGRLGAQGGPAPPPMAPLSDNSFLIEEAYNQEPGVVQHISLFAWERRTGSWLYAFTQEWPAWSHRHQLSYTIPLAFQADTPSGGETGLGDVLLNYRYQLLDARVALAPRVSALLPTGHWEWGAGAGTPGVQVAAPMSVRMARWLTFHLNSGLRVTPSARNADGQHATTLGLYAGGSAIFFLLPRLNALVEGIALSDEQVVGEGRTSRSSGGLASVGIRWGHDFSSGLQIVPGIALAVGTGAERDADGLLFYLSFEHRFRRAAR